MAIIVMDEQGVSHLRSHMADKALCGQFIMDTHEEEEMLVCEHCAKAALLAIATSTKKERKQWRDLLC